jgi:hypothetical protein
VQCGEHKLDRGSLLHRVHVNRDAPAVVDHPDPTIGKQRHLDLRGVPRHRLVDRVVHNLPHQMVQATLAGGADVHARAFANRLQALEDGDRLRGVVVLLCCHGPGFSSRSSTSADPIHRA